MPRRRALAVALVALAAACAGDGDGDGASPTTSARGPSTSAVVGPTVDADRCEAVEPPDGQVASNEASGDVDGDGAADTLVTYRPVDSPWHLQVTLAAGGGADAEVASGGGADVTPVGGADVDGDGRDEIWMRTGQGASAIVLGLARLQGCELAQVTVQGRGPAELAVGGSVGTTVGVECDPDARDHPDTHLVTYVGSFVADDLYDVQATAYRLDGTELVEVGTSRSEARVGDDRFARATGFTCGDLGI